MIEDFSRQPQWKMLEQEEHAAISQRAFELFEARGCEPGQSELHLNE